VMRLNPVNYRMNNNEFPSFGTSNELQYGFLTQEVSKIFPDMVAEESVMDPNAPKGARQDRSKIATPYSCMNYQALIPVLTRAIQEQQVMIQEMQLEIERLSALAERH
ncbi:MAG: tail fiber domain-containing protein, partial [Flavobacteriales bacterium]|nr:tail fiber domain-containing protein [Flavobacteriales bacterium]